MCWLLPITWHCNVFGSIHAPHSPSSSVGSEALAEGRDCGTEGEELSQDAQEGGSLAPEGCLLQPSCLRASFFLPQGWVSDLHFLFVMGFVLQGQGQLWWWHTTRLRFSEVQQGRQVGFALCNNSFSLHVLSPHWLLRVIYPLVTSGQTRCTHFVLLHEENATSKTFFLYGKLFPSGWGHFSNLTLRVC